MWWIPKYISVVYFLLRLLFVPHVQCASVHCALFLDNQNENSGTRVVLWHEITYGRFDMLTWIVYVYPVNIDTAGPKPEAGPVRWLDVIVSGL